MFRINFWENQILRDYNQFLDYLKKESDIFKNSNNILDENKNLELVNFNFSELTVNYDFGNLRRNYFGVEINPNERGLKLEKGRKGIAASYEDEKN